MSTATGIEDDAPAQVVGIGASAGGIDACKRLLSAMPTDTGWAFVIVLHLDPDRESHVAEILERATPMPVKQVDSEERLERDRVYVIGPAVSLGVRDGVLTVRARSGEVHETKLIDVLFSSLAEVHREHAVGVVLSGSGDDGTAGMRAIAAAGGLCVAQDPKSAAYGAMPSSAIASGAVHAVASPEAMPGVLIEHVAEPRRRVSLARTPQATAEPRALEGFEGILALLARHHGLDFRAYKKGTLLRRAEQRMALQQQAGWDEYLAYLYAHPGELDALYSDLLIGVSSFFRDPDAWVELEERIVPAILDSHPPDQPVRVWSAGCATGEEAYSLAMVFLEQLEHREGPPPLVVFATDVCSEALELARRGSYPASIADDISPARVERFFHRQGDRLEVDRRVRDVVTFAEHDLLSDPPFSSLDLVSCRNVLIYLEQLPQRGILDLFHFALRPRGVLWLGPSESVGQNDLFSVLSAPHRLYGKFRRGAPLPRRVPRAGWTGGSGAARRTAPLEAASKPAHLSRAVERLLLERYVTACAIVDRSGNVLHLYGPTERYLVQPKGELRLDLLSWVQPWLYARLRAALEQAISSGASVTVTGPHVERGDERVRVQCTVEPLGAESGVEGLFLILFRDAPHTPAPVVEVGEPDPLARQLERELHEVRIELSNTRGELDAVDQEYRASNEELVSLNEELQSSNEELETSKEELQSLNEELVTINRQLEERNSELRGVNLDLEGLLHSAAVPTIFLETDLRIRRFTPTAPQVMWLTPADVGRSIDHIKKRVQDNALTADARAALEGLVPIEKEVSSGEGRWFLRKITPYGMNGHRVEGLCVNYFDVTAQKHATEASEEARHFAEAIVRASPIPFLVLDGRLRVVSANEAFYETFRVTREETEGAPIYELGNRQWDIPRLRELLDRILAERSEVRGFDVDHTFERIGRRQMSVNASVMERPDRSPLILISVEDLTGLRRAESAAERRAAELEREHSRKDEFLAMLGHELRNPLAAVVSGIDLLGMLGDDPARSEEVRTMLRHHTMRMAAMLDQLLDIARIVSGKIQLGRDVVDVVEVIEHAITTVRPLVGARAHELSIALPGRGSIFVIGDAMRLEQVAENLLTNAAKYTDEHGKIWISVEASEGTVQLVVRDAGIGMEPELLASIFDVFTQGPRALDRAQGGLGLGLPLVRFLAQMHGGSVDVSSPGPGQGSTFVVKLPRARLASTHKGGEKLPGTVKPRRILVVDDEADLAETIVQLLARLGHDARAAHDGTTALEVARTFRPEVVLLDLGLPLMDGYEVARRLRQEHGPVPRIVATTGYARDLAGLRRAGFDDHVLKPIDLRKLNALLGEDDA